MSLVSRKDVIEDAVMNNLLQSHARVCKSGAVSDISRLTKLILRVARNLKNMQMTVPDISNLRVPSEPSLHEQTLPNMWESCGLTVDSVARALEIDTDAVMAWMRGDSSPRHEQAESLAVLLRCDVLDIYRALIRTPIQG